MVLDSALGPLQVSYLIQTLIGYKKEHKYLKYSTLHSANTMAELPLRNTLPHIPVWVAELPGSPPSWVPPALVTNPPQQPGTPNQPDFVSSYF